MERKQVDVSIVIVARGESTRLRETVDSVVRSASGRPEKEYAEILLVDGGDNEGLEAVSESTLRWRVIRDSGKGIYAAMNLACKESEADWLYFLNCGDRLQEGFWEMLSKIRAGTGARDCGIKAGKFRSKSSGETMYASSRVLTGMYLAKGFICHQALMMNRRMLVCAGCFDIRYRYIADKIAIRSMISRGSCIEWHDEVMVEWEEDGECRNNLVSFGEEVERFEEEETCLRERIVGKVLVSILSALKACRLW